MLADDCRHNVRMLACADSCDAWCRYVQYLLLKDLRDDDAARIIIINAYVNFFYNKSGAYMAIFLTASSFFFFFHKCIVTFFCSAL